ncbi:hypothetical protein FRC0195_00103 [Corynebacterium diphtheriae]|nr:hypothetical protein FRC0195_00103 [Corynebacterium diphtheriae]
MASAPLKPTIYNPRLCRVMENGGPDGGEDQGRLVVGLRAVPNVNHNDDNMRVHNVSKPDLLAVNALPRNLGSSRAPTSRRNLRTLR